MTLPAFEIGLGFWLVEAWELKEAKGADWCERRKVGMVRRALMTPPAIRPEAVLTTAGVQKSDGAYKQMRAMAAFQCHKCGGCKWAKEPP